MCLEGEPLVIEIGPGKGALTEHLLGRAGRVVAIEIDPELVGRLRSRFASDARLEIVEGDVLKTDLAQWGPGVVAGNLPYYITSPILDRVLAAGPRVSRAVLLVQKEVAGRLTAQSGSRDYGYLTVKVQLRAQPRILFTVPPSAFEPPPKVDSALVELRIGPPKAPDPARFLKFAGLCFRHKRKTLRNNLVGVYGKELLSAQPEASLRAEQLSLERLIELYDRLTSSSPHLVY